MNLYTYVANDPTNLADTSGLQSHSSCGSRINQPDQDDSGATSCSVTITENGNQAQAQDRQFNIWTFLTQHTATAETAEEYFGGLANEIGGCFSDAGCINSIFPGGGMTVAAADAIALQQATGRLPGTVSAVQQAVVNASGARAGTRRTFAALLTSDGSIIVAQSSRNFTAAERAGLPAWAIVAQSGPRIHAEQAALAAARARGLTPVAIATTPRAPCPGLCAPSLRANAVEVVGW